MMGSGRLVTVLHPIWVELADLWIPLVDVVDGTITSWLRDPVQNAAVGGAELSQHLLGLAIDVVTPDPASAVELFRQQGFVAVDEGTHVHVQALPAGSIPRQVFQRFGLVA